MAITDSESVHSHKIEMPRLALATSPTETKFNIEMYSGLPGVLFLKQYVNNCPSLRRVACFTKMVVTTLPRNGRIAREYFTKYHDLIIAEINRSITVEGKREMEVAEGSIVTQFWV